MANVIIPHTFIAGTKAKADEVNENFIALKTAIETKVEMGGDSSVNLNVAEAVEDTHAVTLSQLNNVKNDVLNQINVVASPYSVKSGNYTDGNPDLFSSSGTLVTPKVGDTYPDLVVRYLDGQTVTRSSLNTIDMSAKANGVFNIFLPFEGNAYTLKNIIYYQAGAPDTPQNNDVWVNTGIEPLTVKKYSNSEWVDFNDVPLGSITILSNAITDIKTFGYNQNGYNVNSESFKPGTKLVEKISDLGMPDFAHTISKAGNYDHVAETNLYVFGYFGAGGGYRQGYFYIDGREVARMGHDDDGIGTYNPFSFLVPKGARYKFQIVGGGGVYLNACKLKGVL